MQGDQARPRKANEPNLPGLTRSPGTPQPDRSNFGYWLDRLRPALDALLPEALQIAEEAVRACSKPELLPVAGLAALVADKPDRALGFLRRFEKKYEPSPASALLTALALAQQGHHARAWPLLQQHGLDSERHAARWFVGTRGMVDWLSMQLTEIRRVCLREQREAQAAQRREARAAERRAAQKQAAAARAPGGEAGQSAAGAASPPRIADLPRLEVALDLAFTFADPDAVATGGALADPVWFGLRHELVQLGLVEGFDELLSLPTLRGVEAHWYQIETVRKVLKQYRGRVLLADEVGLGKTVEAGMVLKEYRLRGMAEQMLILTPASLVGQWHEEMAQKFGIDCATTHDPLLRNDPAAFWAQPRVIASIATARRRDHAALLAGRTYDVVVVDEAHHLRDQASASYRLVNALQKRFLLLLSATPVQNNLIELYPG
jgi:hypothetical protein